MVLLKSNLTILKPSSFYIIPKEVPFSQRSKKCFICVPSGCFISFSFQFRPVTCFELIFVFGIRLSLHFFARKYAVFLALFVEKTILSLPICLDIYLIRCICKSLLFFGVDMPLLFNSSF